MLRIITCNVNGIRSAANKGLFKWLATQQASIICLQEIKVQEHQLSELVYLKGYHAYFFCAQKKGYSGVAIYTKHLPQQVNRGLGWEVADKEGRYIQVDFNTLSIASIYLPSGTSGEERQEIKYDFLSYYEKRLKTQKEKKRDFIICGDWNIAHQPIDLKNWRSNQKHSGFLPEERAWIDKVFNDLNYVDAFRVINQEVDQYTWWSYRGKAWAKNIGWRIDYQVTTASLKDKIKAATIYKSERFSDHAPLIIDYDLSQL